MSDAHSSIHLVLLTILAETTTLTSGLELERTLYYSSFSLRDCKEGIAAFLEKRSPNFVDE